MCLCRPQLPVVLLVRVEVRQFVALRPPGSLPVAQPPLLQHSLALQQKVRHRHRGRGERLPEANLRDYQFRPPLQFLQRPSCQLLASTQQMVAWPPWTRINRCLCNDPEAATKQDGPDRTQERELRSRKHLPNRQCVPTRWPGWRLLERDFRSSQGKFGTIGERHEHLAAPQARHLD